jgi:hypothetical protein
MSAVRTRGSRPCVVSPERDQHGEADHGDHPLHRADQDARQVMPGLAWWKAVAIASQYLLVLLAGPVP